MSLASEEINTERQDPYDSNCSIASLFKSEEWYWMSFEVRQDGGYCTLYKGKKRQSTCSYRFYLSSRLQMNESILSIETGKALNRLLLLETCNLWISEGNLI